ncbi:MAG: beta-ketoacyl-[acyl-carrier-protein] synthase II, partial [Planctomycetes bacterium]|nr:beta-ketoacyl-[acyl-carrier-protein] synthase II [Planctomycetota bacterium]
MGDRRVVVTGLGVITPLGVSVSAFWDSLIAGRTGIRRVRRFDPAPYNVQIGGECLDFDADDFIEHRCAKRMDRFAQLGLAAAKMAVADAGLEPGQFEPTRAGVILGSGIGGLQELEIQHKRLLSKGPGRVSAFTIPKLMANA